MAETTHISFRAGEELDGSIDDIADRYGMNRSQLLRLVVGKSVKEIEEDGLDAFVDDGGDSPGQDGEETDDAVAGQPAN